ncbi:MAG: hypothetical protein OXD31_03700 [Chloroflexi bacterium]|nr:hypothetical protein [Chloroflexota bacterium]
MTQQNMERRILSSACQRHDIDPELVDNLIAIERKYDGMLRRQGLPSELEGTIAKYVDGAS